MPQPTRRQTSKLQGHSISLSLRIELVDNMNDDSSLARSDEAPLPVSAIHNEKSNVDATIELKERLQSAEMNCSRLEELYQKYRLRWLEENYRARILKEHAPDGLSTCSPPSDRMGCALSYSKYVENTFA
ncbi:hypothetical protein DFJ58DRAFT_842973 [Suillus subalutaceus]|uniref:uncharacterized protein n=1 Tax=Suillus subalutaceus TaxID=48586 RepID=UPI001B884133|nr:uncharacterized protein DFJ58DRAFT_842973 [Suillus subalutaceus]KAG1848335.1 hypothetical protein DFJ58DRAFT_842973 [Suillus subalutaceus]